MASFLIRWLVRAYGIGVRAYPQRLRALDGQDMVAAFEDLLRGEYARRGLWGLVDGVVRTAVDMPLSAIAAHRSVLGGGRSVRAHGGAGERGRQLAREVRYATRGLLRSPGFALLAVVSLALGMGANTTMLSMVNSILWQDLSVPDPDRVVRLTYTDTHGDHSFSFANFRDVKVLSAPVLEGVFVHDLEPFSIRVEQAVRVEYGEVVSSNYFDVLGVTPAAGRFFDVASADLPGGPAEVVISHSLWTRVFDRAPGVVGSELLLNDHAFTVVGVAPESFTGTKFGLGMDLWVPIRVWRAVEQWSPTWEESRGNRSLSVVGRLRAGVTLAAAEEALRPVSEFLSETHPEINEGYRIRVVSEREGSMDAGSLPDLVGALALAASALVLLVACANVASLFYARGVRRRRELGIRIALGVGRGRLVRQLLVESAVLSVAGSALGVALAFWAGRFLLVFLPTLPYRFVVSPEPDMRVLGLALGIALVTAMVFGLGPALRASRTDPMGTLKGGVDDSEHHRGLTTVVVGMVSFAFVSLVLTGLFSRSLMEIRDADHGFEADQRLVADFDAGLAGDPDLDAGAYYRALLASIAALPGVESVAVTSVFPLSDRQRTSIVYDDGREYQTSEPGIGAWHQLVSAGYFEAAGTRVLQGRAIAPRDGEDSDPTVVVNETLARRLWPEGEWVGRRLRFGRAGGGYTMEVVGVVEDGKYALPSERPRPAIFRPFDQDPTASAMVLVRVRGELSAVAPLVRDAAAAVDARVPLLRLVTVEQHVEGSLYLFRMGAGIGLGLGLLALVLSAAGLYGVMNYAVGQRRTEMGIRMALGAGRTQVLRLFVGRGLRLTGAGLVLGLFGALGLGRVLSSVLYSVAPRDPITLGSVMGLLVVVSLAASSVPALLALRRDPVRALRSEGA